VKVRLEPVTSQSLVWATVILPQIRFSLWPTLCTIKDCIYLLYSLLLLRLGKLTINNGYIVNKTRSSLDPNTVPRLPDRGPTATMIRHAIGSAWRPAPTTLFHVRGRNLATELSLWPGQSCGTVCQRQFVTWTLDSLHSFKRRLKSHFFKLVFNSSIFANYQFFWVVQSINPGGWWF